eukprot:gene12588-6408_t
MLSPDKTDDKMYPTVALFDDDDVSQPDNINYLTNQKEAEAQANNFQELLSTAANDEYTVSISKKPKTFDSGIYGRCPSRPKIIEAKPGDHGEDGSPGKNGKNGPEGAPGETGFDGENGKSGSAGENGHQGENGNDSLSIYLKASKKGDKLKMIGSLETETKISNDTLLYINASGEDGKRGGDGGNGGNGGKGGNGGDGGNGGKGDISEGCRGGNGGNGGNGGDAGEGGNAGDGGNGGNAGNIYLEVETSELLMYFQFDARGGDGGEPGKPGQPGEPGTYGQPGKGGAGGKKARDSKGSDGSFGAIGKQGKTGLYSSEGKTGEKGKTGKHGRIFFKVEETDEIGEKLYCPTIIDYELTGLDNGGEYSISKGQTGIFSPGEKIVIHDILIENQGDLTLPDGTTIILEANEDFDLITKGEEFPLVQKIKPKEQLLTDFKIYGRFNEIEAPLKPGAYLNSVDLSFRCTLLNRTILHSERIDKVEIRYPLLLNKLVSPSVMSPGDSEEFQIDFKNIGDKKRKIGYKVVLLDDNLTFDDDSQEFVGSEIKETKITHSYCKVNLSKVAPYFIKVSWKVELYIDEKMVQYEQKEIRVCPKYNTETVSTDILFITNPTFSHDEYKCYMKIFKDLGLVANFYDLELYSEEPKCLWEKQYRGKLIIFPLFNKESITSLKEQDIVSHFVLNIGESYDELDSGLIVIGNYTNQLLIDNLFTIPELKEYEIPEAEFSDTFYVNQPTKEDMIAKLKQLEELKSTEYPSTICQVKSKEFSPKSLGYFSYAYGKAFMKKLPISKLHKFINIKLDSNVKNYSNSFLTSDTISKTTKSTFTTDSNHFQFILSLISALSIEMKLQLLMNKNLKLKFIHDEIDFDIVQLIQNSLYDDIKQEFFFKDQSLKRVEKLLKFYEDDLDSYFADPGIFTIWYLLSRLESNTFWRSMPFLSSFNEKRSKLSELKEKFGKFLDKKLKLEIQDLPSIKERAEKSAVDPQRLKWKDISKICYYPFVDFK